MKNLIICCDGTWNTQDNKDDGALAPTNVFKLFNAINTVNSSVTQLTRYQAGVGTGGIIDKVVGGAFGFGLSEDIRDCYQWLATKYQPGDNVYLFGFSRGAFTARSLGGLICKFGIAKPNHNDLEAHIKHIYQHGYRNQQTLPDNWFYPNSNNIKFIGVWDTVGSLGIPNDKILLNMFDNPSKYRFHDTKLSCNVEFARHAVAIDEMRGSFSPTLWDVSNTADNNQRIKQVWFAGVHSDVGGGYKESGLSDCALTWMIEEATSTGLEFDHSITKQITPNPLDVKHQSHTGLMKVLVTAPRNIPPLNNTHCISKYTQMRRDASPINHLAYKPTLKFSPHGTIEKDIYAKQVWNWTGIYLQKGQTYTLTATGQWTDSTISCGPKGMSDGKFHIGELAHVAGSVMGALENLWKKTFGNNNANAFGSKRIEHADWFALIGAIADGENPDIDGTHDNLTYFNIGEHIKITPKQSGYLYCFANDAWGFYGNNRGFVTLTVANN